MGLGELSPKESVEGANTVLRDGVRAPEGFSESKQEAAKPRGLFLPIGCLFRVQLLQKRPFWCSHSHFFVWSRLPTHKAPLLQPNDK